MPASEPATRPQRVTVFPAVDPERLAAFRAAAPSLLFDNCETEAEATQAISDADGFLGRPTAAMLRDATSLAWVQANTASLEHFVTPELVASPAVVTNCRGLFGDVISEHVFAMLLTMARNIHRYRDRQRERRFEPVREAEEDALKSSGIDFAAGPHETTPVDCAHHRLQDWSMLLVGVGGIGAAIASRAKAWGMNVAGVDARRRRMTGVIPSIDPPRRLRDCLPRHDVVVVSAPLTPETDGLFDAETIATMRPGARLINVGRGRIVKTDAVVEALRTGQLAGVGLDVFEEEPLPSDHPLWDEPDAILTPHVAAAHPVIAERHLRLLCDNLARFAERRPLRNVVDKAAWY